MPVTYIDYNSDYAYDSPINYNGEINAYGRTVVNRKSLKYREFSENVSLKGTTNDVSFGSISVDGSIGNDDFNAGLGDTTNIDV